MARCHWDRTSVAFLSRRDGPYLKPLGKIRSLVNAPLLPETIPFPMVHEKGVKHVTNHEYYLLHLAGVSSFW